MKTLTASEAAKAVVRRNTVEVQGKGNFSVFEELFADDFVDHTPQPNMTPDKAGVRKLYSYIRDAFPDFRAEIHWQLADGDRVTTYKTYYGTHEGPLLGVAPTHRKIHFESVDVMRVRDGKITDHWGVGNLLSVMQQIGGWTPPTGTNNTSPQLKAFKRAPSLELSKWENGNLTTNLAEKKDTNGAFLLMEATLEPGTEPPPHIHTREDELFYVLDGEFDVYVGKEAFKVSTGECVFLPKFEPHAFVIRSPRLRVLALFTPAGLEEAFGAMSSPAQSLDVPTGTDTYSTGDLKQVAQLLADYGARFLTSNEVAGQLPLYPTPLPSSAGKFTDTRAAAHV
jgi:steroid delta-isomerase-like uncharacterized protein